MQPGGGEAGGGTPAASLIAAAVAALIALNAEKIKKIMQKCLYPLDNIGYFRYNHIMEGVTFLWKTPPQITPRSRCPQ